MPICENIKNFIRRYKDENKLSVAELAQKLGIAKSAAANYLSRKGTCNPRADTIELLAKRCGVSPAEIISDRPPERAQAETETETLVRAAAVLSRLSGERREEAIRLFLALTILMSEENRA